MIDTSRIIVSRPETDDNLVDQILDLSSPNQTPKPSVTLVAPGEWVDPRVTIQGKVEDIFDEIVNAKAKTQRSVRIKKTDGSYLLVSAFGSKMKQLEGLKLGYSYEFTGILKEKEDGTFLNLK